MTAPSTTALTVQERRVAGLAAQRRTNSSISAELHITVSTVEQHLTKTFRKLGIRSRAELADALTDTTGGRA